MKRDDNGNVVNTGKLFVYNVPDDVMQGLDAYVLKYAPKAPGARQTGRGAVVVELLRCALARLPIDE